MPNTRQAQRVHPFLTMPHREQSVPQTAEDRTPSRPQSPIQNDVNDMNMDVGTPTASNTDSPPTSQAQFHDTAAMDAITSRPKVLIKTIAELTFLNLDDKIQPPNIVVTGDQSAGKSSLIEGITGIKMPRDVGTCTRCPVHVSLSECEEGATWDCSIFIERSYTYNPDLQPDEVDVTGLGPWSENDQRETILFQKLQDPNDVEGTLRRAQEAILDSTHTRYQSKARMLEFSPNIIRLDITGPGLPDLSFFDLPGVIATHKSGDSRLPDLVRTLAMKYLQQSANIVLLAIPMGNDIETCQARALVNRSHAEARTIGVLTKPDMMPLGDPVQMWRSILNGADHRLGHGYFVSKQPNQIQNKAGITNEEARAAEEGFFTTQHPWCAGEFSQFRDRFGTNKIANKLSELLVDEIKKSIPRIRTQIRQHIEEIDTQLENIPPPTKHANLVVLSIVSSLNQLVNQTMDSRYPNNQFWNQWKAMVGTLRTTLENMRPSLVVDTPQDCMNTSDVIELDSDMEVQQANSRKRGKVSLQSPVTKKNKSRGRSGRRKFYLNQIRDILRTVSASGLPNSVDPSATDHIISDALQDWGQPFEAFMDETEDALQEHMRSLLERELRPWQGTALDREARASVRDFVTGSIQFVLDQVKRMVHAELQKPLTFNEEAQEDNKKKEWDRLRAARRECRAKEFLTREEQYTGASRDISDAARAAKIKKISDEQIGPDPFAKEIEVVADMRAYYNIASCSLLDGVSKIIQMDLFQNCRSKIANHLRESLRLDDEDGPTNCERLLEENPERAAYREELLKKKTKYLEAQRHLENAIQMV